MIFCVPQEVAEADHGATGSASSAVKVIFGSDSGAKPPADLPVQADQDTTEPANSNKNTSQQVQSAKLLNGVQNDAVSKKIAVYAENGKKFSDQQI